MTELNLFVALWVVGWVYSIGFMIGNHHNFTKAKDRDANWMEYFSVALFVFFIWPFVIGFLHGEKM